MKTGVEMLAVELLPCPFCGSGELSHGSAYPGYGQDMHGLVQCHSCDAYMLGGEEDDAIAAWNTRHAHHAATGSVRGWKLVPVKATALMEQAGSGYIFEDGINHEARCDAATHVWSAMLAAAPTPDAAASEAGEVSDLAWLSGQHRLSLQFHSPMYGDDDDQSQEWRVDKESGPINDREWDTVGRGFTAAEAIAAARAALTTQGGVKG